MHACDGTSSGVVRPPARSPGLARSRWLLGLLESALRCNMSGQLKACMGFILEFDSRHNILRGTLKGQLTDAILFDCYAAATRYTDSHPPCRGIWNFAEVTEFQLSSNAVRQAESRRPIISTGYARIVVAPQDYIFGMMRMLEILSEKSRPELRVVRTMEEAYRLLGVETPEFKAVAPE
jgi:hypothetical protein